MDSKNTHEVDSCYHLLALCARAEAHSGMDSKLIEAAWSFTAWDELPEQAELHGMGPLLWHHLRRLELFIPEDTRKILGGMYLRHRAFHQTHVQVLLEVALLLEQNHIHALVLKGLALAYEYYPDPTLRPASDIDLLFKKEDVLPALKVLEMAGYTHQIPAQADLKPLPRELTILSPLKNGLSIQIELHHAGLDQDASDEFTGFDSPSHDVHIKGGVIHVPHFMDHLDYLIRHFTRHLFAATGARPLPLKWIADIVNLVESHAQEINWKGQPALLNRLEAIYSLTPFPERLSSVIPLKGFVVSGGVNQYPRGWPQHRFAEWRQVGFLNYLGMTFSSPSAWWLRLYYGIDQKSVFWYGQVTYRLQVLKMASLKGSRG